MKGQKITYGWIAVALAIFAGALTIALTGVAFWLSYEHLHDVAGAHGLPATSPRAWAWPATLDTFIVIGEVLILRASLLGKSDWWAITLAAIGSAGSITLNVVGVGSGADALDYTVAAVPPVAALLAFGALMRQLHGMIKSYLKDVPVADTSSVSSRDVPVMPDRAPVVVPQDTGTKAAPDKDPGTSPDTDVPEKQSVRVDMVKRDRTALHLVGGTSSGKIPGIVRDILSANPDATNEEIRTAVQDKLGPDTKTDSIRKAANRARKDMSA